MFGHAYAIEVGYAVSATAVLLGLVWLIRTSWLHYRDAAHADKPHMARALTWGRLHAALWHFVLVAIITWISWLSLWTAPPAQAGHFWDPAQLTVGRGLFLLMIVSHGMMIDSVNRSYRRVHVKVLEDVET